MDSDRKEQLIEIPSALEVPLDNLSSTREPQGYVKAALAVIAIGYSLFHLYTAAFGVLLAHQQRIVHLSVAMLIGYMLFPINRKFKEGKVPFYDILLGLAAIACLAYVLNDYRAFISRSGMPLQLDLIIGAIYLVLVLELTRRAIGLPMVIIAVVFILYALFGRQMPGILAHRGVNIKRLLDHMFMGTEGVFGIPIGASSTFIAIFILLGSFLEVTGVGKFFIEFALSLVGRSVGGPAKTAVLSSALLGIISGSSVANVVTTGIFTIPLMIKNGYKRAFAGAVEAAASTGGQLMPPVMGAAAFIMVEYTGIKYGRIALAAAIPALLYYIGVFFAVHQEAKKNNLKGLSKEEVPSLYRLLRYEGLLMLPVVAVIYSLAIGNTPMRAGFLGIVAAVIVGLLRRASRLKLKDVFDALKSGSKSIVSVAVACAAAGIIGGAISVSGIGLKMAGYIEIISGGNLLIALMLTMVASLILGMGLPTTATYVVLVTIAAPALTRMGVPLLGAHLFVFYFGVIADITPPVALAAYAASGLAKSNAFETGMKATRIAIAGFLVPYMFIYAPKLILIGMTASFTWWAGLGVNILTASLGLWLMASAFSGFAFNKLAMFSRVLLVVSALLLIDPNFITDIIGLVLGIVVLLVQRRIKQ